MADTIIEHFIDEDTFNEFSKHFSINEQNGKKVIEVGIKQNDIYLRLFKEK